MLSSSYNSGKNSAIWFWTFLVEWHNPISLLLDLDLQFHGQSFSILLDLRISRKWWEIEQKLLLPSDGKSSIFHGMTLLWMLYIMILTYIFKVTNFEMWTSRKLWELLNGAIPEVVFYDVGLLFQGKIFQMLIIRQRWELRKNINFDFYRRWYLPSKWNHENVTSVTLTSIFKVKTANIQ